MIEVAYANIQSKTKTNGLISDFFYSYIRDLAEASTLILWYISVVEVLAIFINADKRIKGVKINHETEK